MSADNKKEGGIGKMVAAAAITAVVVIIVLVLWSTFTKTVEIDDSGKTVAGGKRFATRLGLAKASRK